MRGYRDAMASSVPSVGRVAAVSPLVFLLGGTLDLLLTDDTVGEVALRGLFVVAFIIIVTVLSNAAQRRSRRRPRER
jgi:hypothetical protein